jgi:hypothetical protein
MNERGFYEELACVDGVHSTVCMNSCRNRGQ